MQLTATPTVEFLMETTCVFCAMEVHSYACVLFT